MADQVITTQFKSAGAQRVAKDTEVIGRAQTRLGQASASAGRSFSAQANGLGGLVGIYAAAAANVFAIGAAFTALNRAAQFGTIIQGTQNLAQAVGSTATEVVTSLKNITDGQLSIVEAATQANLALSAGFNVDQIEQLGNVALKASRALGRNLTDSFQRITRGAIKLEPELLDEIGIFTRIEPAVEAFANSINKSVSQLTQFERRQAFVNQVIKDGEAAFADIQDEGTSTQEVFETLVANFSDLAIIVGKFLADSLVPFAEFLDKNLGNRLILLGGIGALVFGKLREAVGTFASAGLAALSERLSGVADGFANVKKLGDDFAKQQKAAAAAFVGQGAVAGPRGVGAQIKRDLAGPISTKRAQEIQEQLPKLIAAETANQERLKNTVAKTAEEQKKVTAALDRSVARSAALGATSKVIDRQLKASGVSANLLAKGLRGASVAANLLGSALNKAFAIFNTILIGFTALQAILSFFDFDLFSEIKEAISSINKDAKDAAKGIEAIEKAAKRAGGEVGFLAEKMSLLGVDTASAQGIIETVNRINELGEVSRQVAIGRLQNEMAALSTVLGRIFNFKGAEAAKERIKEIESILEILNDIEKSAAAKAITDTATAVTVLGERIASSFDAPAQEIIDQLGRLVNDGLLVLEKGAIRVAETELFSGGLDLGSIDNANAAIAATARDAADAAGKFDKLNKALQEGTITASRASRDVGVITSLLNKQATVLGEQLARASDPTIIAELSDALVAVNDAITLVNETTQQTVNQFTNLDQLGKQLGKTFGSDFKSLDERFLTGAVSAETGKIAKNAEEQQLFQAQNLGLLQKQQAALRAAGGDQAIIQQLEANIQKVRKAAQAENLKLVQSTEQIRLAEEKRLQALVRQLKLLQAQFALNEVINKNRLAALKDAGDVRLRQAQVKNAEAEAKLAAERRSNSELTLQNERRITELQNEGALAAQRRDQKAFEFDLGQRDARGERELLAFRQNIAKIEQTTLTSEQDLIRNQIAILEREEKLALDQLSNRKLALQAEEVSQQLGFKNRLQSLQLEARILRNRNNNARAELRAEEAALDRQESIEALRLRNEGRAAARSVEEAQARRDNAEIQAELNFIAKNQELDLIDKRYALLEATIKVNEANIAAQEKIIVEQQRLAGTFAGEMGISASFEQESGVARSQIGVARGGLAESKGVLESIRDAQIALADQTLASEEKLASERTRQVVEEILERNKNFDLQKKIFAERETALQLEFANSRGVLLEKLKQLEAERLAFEELHASKQTALAEEAEAIKADFAARKAALEFQLTAQFRYLETLREVRDVISNEIGSVVDKLFQNIADGKNVLDDFGETLRNSFEAVRKKVLEKTLIEPLQRQFEGAFNSFFNLQEEKKIEDALTSGAGGTALRTIDAGGTSDAIKEVLDKDTGVIKKTFDAAQEGVESFGTKVSNTFSNLGNNVSNIFSSIGSALSGSSGGGGILGFLGQGGLNFGQLLGGPSNAQLAGTTATAASSVGMSGFGELGRVMASGGFVRMASGGMMRDRVPALLEPGEFVMKRSAARGIGGPALNRMNATGSAGGNVVVNIKNEGTPQEATASQPMFDGEKFVVDIVTRDLRNNGPIRKSMRGGS